LLDLILSCSHTRTHRTGTPQRTYLAVMLTRLDVFALPTLRAHTCIHTTHTHTHTRTLTHAHTHTHTHHHHHHHHQYYYYYHYHHSCAHSHAVTVRYLLKKTAKLPVRWVALEALETGVFSQASDVWACVMPRSYPCVVCVNVAVRMHTRSKRTLAQECHKNHAPFAFCTRAFPHDRVVLLGWPYSATGMRRACE
jgi:hypothetical protein